MKNEKEKHERDLAFSLILLSQISNKDESIPGKVFNIGKDVSSAMLLIKHRE